MCTSLTAGQSNYMYNTDGSDQLGLYPYLKRPLALSMEFPS